MRTLTSMAEKVDEEFDEVTVHIDGGDRHTLIVHTSSEEKADEVDSFLEDMGRGLNENGTMRMMSGFSRYPIKICLATTRCWRS